MAFPQSSLGLKPRLLSGWQALWVFVRIKSWQGSVWSGPHLSPMFSFLATSVFTFHTPGAPNYRNLLMDGLFTSLCPYTCFHLCLEHVFPLPLPTWGLLTTTQILALFPPSKKPFPLAVSCFPSKPACSAPPQPQYLIYISRIVCKCSFVLVPPAGIY